MITFSEHCNLDEALSVRQRLNKGRTLKRNEFKMKLKKKQAENKKAPYSTLQRRAIMQAKTIIRKKILDEAGVKYSDLNDVQKKKLDHKLEMKMGKIKLIAQKLMPKIKQEEAERVSKLKNLKAATTA